MTAVELSIAMKTIEEPQVESGFLPRGGREAPPETVCTPSETFVLLKFGPKQ